MNYTVTCISRSATLVEPLNWMGDVWFQQLSVQIRVKPKNEHNAYRYSSYSLLHCQSLLWLCTRWEIRPSEKWLGFCQSLVFKPQSRPLLLIYFKINCDCRFLFASLFKWLEKSFKEFLQEVLEISWVMAVNILWINQWKVMASVIGTFRNYSFIQQQ